MELQTVKYKMRRGIQFENDIYQQMDEDVEILKRIYNEGNLK